MNKRLTRSRTDVILGGVCSGLANYLGIDPVFVRIFFILVGVFGGFAVLLYLILWVVRGWPDSCRCICVLAFIKH